MKQDDEGRVNKRDIFGDWLIDWLSNKWLE